MIVDLRGDDQLVGARQRDALAQLVAHRVARADRRERQRMRDGREFELVRLEHVDGRRQLARRAAPQVDELLLQRREQAPRLVVGLGREHVDADHRMRLRPRGRRPVLRAVDLERPHQIIRREVRRERERQPEHRRELRAEQARTEQPHRDVEPRAGYRPHALAGYRLREIALQLRDVVRKRVRTADQVAAQRARRGLVGAGRAAQAEIDAPRIQRRERAELFGDHERRVVRQHDAARADPDRPRRARDVADHDGGGRTRDPRHVVMLGQPVAPVAPAFRVLREIDGVAERLRGVGAGRNGGEIEYGKRCHRKTFETGWRGDALTQQTPTILPKGSGTCWPRADTHAPYRGAGLLAVIVAKINLIAD
ncbi:hypothetical protein BURCENBC7_AP5996 [Burkholderia cenocepacia BC7]|nr:hypothetical protein BURCENK562V_C6089 [Burkholderia cenocepacia K56-2Valvano]ERI25882.1 hypothetical protein BURCENBC7_AP5996 [Burkholderia cenocepacia BC7]